MRHRLARLGWPACGLATLVCIILGVTAPRSDILTTIAIDAPPAAVWSVLTDTDAYPTWNPMITALEGVLKTGAVVRLVEGSGADRTVIRPTILVAERDRELRWRGRLWGMPGLFMGEHYFLLRPTPRGTLFTQGEHFTGVLLWLFDPRDLVPVFEVMNVALAARVAR